MASDETRLSPISPTTSHQQGRLPPELRDLIFSYLSPSSLLTTSSTCVSWRSLLSARAFTHLSLVAEDFESCLLSPPSLSALRSVGSHARSVLLRSRCYPEAYSIPWIPTGIETPITYYRNFLPSLSTHPPLLPCVSELRVTNVVLERFEHLCAFLDLLGPSLRHVTLSNLSCSGFTYNFFSRRPLISPFAPLTSLSVHNEKYSLRIEPIVAWLRAIPDREKFERASLTCHDTSDSLALLAFFIGTCFECLPELELRFVVQGGEPQYMSFDSGLQSDHIQVLTLHSKIYPGRDLLDELLHFSSFRRLHTLRLTYDFAGVTYAAYEPGPLLDPKEPVAERYPELKTVGVTWKGCEGDVGESAREEIVDTTVFLGECREMGVLRVRWEYVDGRVVENEDEDGGRVVEVQEGEVGMDEVVED